MITNAGSAIYGATVAARNLCYDRGWLSARRLLGPVISVGNISSGGAGKTPFVIMLGELLRARGIAFDVLSRGYGRTSRGVFEVKTDGAVRDFGDEPLLIAQKLRVPVVVGEDRYEAGRFAEKKFGPRTHLLDDGFQHRGLARDFDIVLVTPEDAQDRLLPAGRLRETLSALRRADAVALISGTSAAQFPVIGNKSWRVRRGIIVNNPPPRPLVFCGIARPRNFFSQLRDAGMEPAAEAVFGDHHTYTEKDIHGLLALRQSSEAGGFVTTEKDCVNLGEFAPQLVPLVAIPVKMELENADDAVDTMLRVIGQRHTQA